MNSSLSSAPIDSPSPAPLEIRPLRRYASWLALVALLVVIVRCAWICDDAYITLRSVDNLVNGLGATWNPGERVQVYTHPLWMLLLSLPYSLTHEAFLTTIGTSLFVTSLFLVLLWRGHASDPGRRLLVIVALLVSKSFVDYSTSGLENPLTHVFICVGYFLYWERPAGARKLLLVTLTAALAACNRPDSLLLFVPPVLALALGEGRRAGWPRTLGFLLAAASPLLLWELFSVFYYGQGVPNTAFAKLNTGIPAGALWAQGWRYLGASFRSDPAGLGMLLLGLGLALRSRLYRPAGLAILLQLCYLMSVGGDFMVGRQFTAPVVLALLVIARAFPTDARLSGALVLLLLGVGLAHPSTPLRSGRDYSVDLVQRNYGKGIADERAVYFPTNGLLRLSSAEHPWAAGGRSARRQAQRMERIPVVVRGTVGMIGYHAGPGVHFIDELALCDPLLARLPIPNPKRWRIGHFTRDLPAGYRETRASGKNKIEDPDLAAYWDQLSLVITGKLWSKARLGAIWNQLWGKNEALLDAYLSRIPARSK